MSVDVRYCPHCGTRRTGYFRFCGRCGLDFDELRIGPLPEAPPEPPKPELTTPIWPPPVQWPPPDAAPPPLPEPEPEPVSWPQQRAPATPSRVVEAPTAPPILPEIPAPPQPRSATAVEPVPEAPVVPRRPALTWTRIAIVVLAALLAVNAISRAMSTSRGSAPTPVPTVALGSPVIVGSASAPATSATVTPGPDFGPTGQAQAAVVTKVVDGDTIRVSIDGTEYSVRYIGIDAFEPGATDPAVKALADAATATNTALVEGKEVVLERDVSETDQFNRLLRNVWLVDSGGSQVLVNLELVRLGFAIVTTFPPDEKYEAYLVTAQETARTEALGMWAPVTQASSASPAAVTTPNTLVGAGGASDCHPSYTPCLPIVGDLDCADVRDLGKAPVRLKGPDEYRLDSDKDGLGCE